MVYKGVIFDFNGVLWWDTEIQHAAWIEFSRGLRGSPLTVDEMAIHVHGRPNRHTMEYLAGKRLKPSELSRLVQKKESIYRSMCLKKGEKFRLSPGARRLLNHLKAKGIPMIIATASEITNLRFFFRHLGLSHWFEIRRTAYDDGTLPGKPAPDIYLKAASLIGLRPADCIVVEDSISGLQAAYAAGIGMIIALGPAEKKRRLLGERRVKGFITSFSGFDYALLG